MKRRRFESFEDMANAPEGEWFEMPRGVKLEVLDLTTAKGRGRARRMVAASKRKAAEVRVSKGPAAKGKSKRAKRAE